jgi:hypothetical protein
LPHIPGISSFSNSIKRASKTSLDGIDVFILGYDDLIKNKTTVGRDIDFQDIQELKKRKKQ